jgi:hypothetical protein
MGSVIRIGNTAILATAAVAGNGLCLLPSGRLCLALRLLGALWLLALRLLGALRLCLALRLLGALWLRFLCTLLRLGSLRALLWLRFLRALLRLRLVLRRLGFCSALFLLAFLC